ncbi:MAG: hypothetical protein VXV96_06155 [Bdellovibrionota bacterium]|nr:hypothetical protein [Bdellovibrionota bacterium]
MREKQDESPEETLERERFKGLEQLHRRIRKTKRNLIRGYRSDNL